MIIGIIVGIIVVAVIVMGVYIDCGSKCSYIPYSYNPTTDGMKRDIEKLKKEIAELKNRA